MNGSDSKSLPNSEQTSLSLDDIEAALCGTATPEQHARYCAAMNNPDSELSHLLNHIQTSPSNVLNQSLPYPARTKHRPVKRSEIREDAIEQSKDNQHRRGPSILEGEGAEVMRGEAHSLLTSITPTAPVPSVAGPPLNEDVATNVAKSAEGSPVSIASQPASVTSTRHTDRARRSRSWLTVTIASVAIIGIAVFVSRMSPRSTSLVASIDDPLGKVARDATGIHGLEAFPQEWHSDITVMLETGRVQASNIALNFRRGTRGNDSPDTAYIQPKGTVVRTTTPQFLWKPLGEGVTYEVMVFAINDELPPVSSGELTETSWTVPELTPLSQGVVYEWEVVVRGEGPEHVPDELHRPRFKVIAIDALAAIQEAEKAARGSHLVLTAAYLDAGLLDEAHRELDKLAAENPKSPIVVDWLKSLELQR